MIKKITLLLIILFCNTSFSQNFELRQTPYLESKLVYNDESFENGLLRFASSIFDPRIKSKIKGKERKIDYEKIDRIITNPETKSERIFQYKNYNYSKFKIFTELVYSDKLSIYISLNEPLNLFYSNYDRETFSEYINQVRKERAIDEVNNLQGLDYGTREKKTDTLYLPSGKKVELPASYDYVDNLESTLGLNQKFNFFLLKEGDSTIYRVEKNKRFLKKAKKMLGDCPRLIEDLELEKIIVEELATFIEYYKNVCLE